MRRIVLFFLLQFLVANFLFAQTEELTLKFGDKGLYVEHKITPKENFYSLGRSFNVPPKYLATYNSLDMAKGLSIGQVIKIPLTDTNFSQSVNEGMPVYTIAGEKESLSRISSRNNKVSIENLKAWNDLSGDNAGNSKKLIVGFLTSGELAKANSIVIAKKEPAINPETTKKKVEAVKKTEPVVDDNINKEENKETVKEEPKKEETVKEAVKMETTTTSGLGYFMNDFQQQIKVYPLSKEVTVTSGIFKTTSGWQDAKYYALMDGVDPGTVIKVTNPSNNKSIYAKVLGAMKGIRQNQGLDLRISDAAISALEISDPDKFIVKVNY
ncbi:MAG TPA: LysM peptidoglycan-binding domain-containing protein [Chitinophagaceae bacterium]|nr:LysM peptidoglycan-binding domain-containing protein [Chitinophagaceae bacterium]